MANRFGGVPIEEETQGSNRFGGISLEDQTPTTQTIEEVPERSFLEMGGDFATSYGIGSNALLKLLPKVLEKIQLCLLMDL